MSAISSTVLNLQIGQSGSYVPQDLLNYLLGHFKYGLGQTMTFLTLNSSNGHLHAFQI